jgi:transposase
VLDNYGTHKTPKVIRWFARHPRYHLHFTPSSGSWVNQVERWFGEITEEKDQARIIQERSQPGEGYSGIP